MGSSGQQMLLVKTQMTARRILWNEADLRSQPQRMRNVVFGIIRTLDDGGLLKLGLRVHRLRWGNGDRPHCG